MTSIFLHILVEENHQQLGASNYHFGIDIPAYTGTDILSITSGTVSYIGFKGANGYSITIISDNFEITYSHISPEFIVCENEYVIQGQVIAKVGPKYINIPNNTYKDETGKQTNGATTGPHLHLSIKKDGIAVNPLDYISSSDSSSL